MNNIKDTFIPKKGEMVDLISFAYLWRKDREVQEYPEAEFLPRRVERQDKVYRTLLPTLGEDLAKSIHYKQNDLLTPQQPAPKGELTVGALWVGGISDYSVILEWNNCTPPSPNDVEVRIYPTAWGWFGFCLDCNLEGPEISSDGKRWTYHSLKDHMMDFAYSKQVKATTECVAVFAPKDCSVPDIHIVGENLGNWEECSFTVQWGLNNAPDFKGETETHMAYVTSSFLDEDNKTAKYTCLYSTVSRYGNDSKITIILDKEKRLGATVLLRELKDSPIYVPEAGLYFCCDDCPVSLEEYLAKQNKENVVKQIANHPEVTNWEELLKKVRLWRCPDDTEVPEFPDSPSASAVFRVPDKRWETMYNLAVEQLRGHHMWGTLSSEVGRVLLAMELIGLKEQADRIYDYFLASPGVKSDGDFSTGEGSLEWAKDMRHDMGYNHEGTHSSTGKLIFAMMHRYLISGDDLWIKEKLPRIKQAADWLVSQSEDYMSHVKNREDLHCYGLMPPEFLGDYALPCCDWRWYYHNNAYTQMALTIFGKVLTRLGDEQAEYYTQKAKNFEDCLLATVEREGLYAPVRKASDGISRRFLPRMAYAGGLLHFGEETNIPHFALGIGDLFKAALPLGEKGGVLNANHPLMVGTITAMEEGGHNLSTAALNELVHPTATKEDMESEAKLKEQSKSEPRTAKIPVSEEELWFYNTFANLPKTSHNPNIYLRQDKIENFLHFFFNHAIMMVGSNGKMWEHAHPGVFVECNNPDNGTAGWFVENFRNMMITEDEDVLWLIKGTPREWLNKNNTLAAEKVPTMYGPVSYEVCVDEMGVVRVEIQSPERETPSTMKLRLRHPTKAIIDNVTVNGQKVDCVDEDGETLTFCNPKGTLNIVVEYK